MRETGTVLNFHNSRGFGFIKPDAPGRDIFVHVSGLRNFYELEPGDRVRYTLEATDKGPKAVEVERAN